MRKRELEKVVTDLQEQVMAQDVEFSIREATWKQEHLQSLKDAGWSALDPHGTKRNRTWNDVRMNLEDAYAAYCVNPLAKSYVDYQRYFVIGKGTTSKAEETDQEGQKRIDLFLEANDWELLEKDITSELARDGEVFVRFHSKNRLGLESEVARVSLIDPLEVIEITVDENGEPKEYLRRYNVPGSAEPREDLIPASEVHHIKVNSSHNESRGRSDLLVVLPWLKQLKRWIEDMSRRNYYSGAINWDVEVSGGIKPSDISSKYGAGPMPGSVIVHHENEKWSVNSPDMKYADSTQGARAIKLLIMAGYKHPESWYGDTGESNLATTQALAMPTLRAFVDRQDFLKMHFERIISRGAGVENITVTFPELVVEEMNTKAAALFQLSQAFTNLIADGMLSKETAYALLRSFAEELPEWEEESTKLKDEDAESVARVAAGQSAARPAGPRLQDEGAPPVGGVPPASPPAP